MGANNFTAMYRSKRKTRIGNIVIEGVEFLYIIAIVCLLVAGLSYGVIQMFTTSSNALGGAVASSFMTFIIMYVLKKTDYSQLFYEYLSRLSFKRFCITFVENEIHIERIYKSERSVYYVLDSDD